MKFDNESGVDAEGSGHRGSGFVREGTVYRRRQKTVRVPSQVSTASNLAKAANVGIQQRTTGVQASE